MINLTILLILFIGFYNGYKKGIVLKLLQAIGYTMAIIFSLNYYEQLSDYLFLIVPYPTPFAPEVNPYLFYDEQFIFSMDMSYYHILSFLMLLFIGWAVVKFFTTLISFTLEKLRAPEPISGIGGSIIGVGINYIGIFFIIFFLSTIPLDIIQTNLYDSAIANYMISSTPQLSEKMYNRFVVEEHQEAINNLPTMPIQLDDEEEAIEDSENNSQE